MTTHSESNSVYDLRRGVLTACCAMLLVSQPAAAHKLSPRGTPLEQQIAKKYSGWYERLLIRFAGWGFDLFTEPVHEEATERIYGCQADRKDCANTQAGPADDPVIAGVRWNDDPPFRLEEGAAKGSHCNVVETIRFITQPRCWYHLFLDTRQRVLAGELLNGASRASMLGRSHFGDLQFLHAMASKDGELASETQTRILMWAEFTWKVSLGTYGNSVKLRDVDISGFRDFFGLTNWTVQDLFTLGSPKLRSELRKVAFGSLLHMVEDSFAKGHADRADPTLSKMCPGAQGLPAPGNIREFHSYVHQDSAKHAAYDGRKAYTEGLQAGSPTEIDVGKVLLDYNSRGASWEEVKPYLECVFTPEDPRTPASAGVGFR